MSFVIFGHETWDLEGGGQIDPPQHILVASTPAGIGLKRAMLESQWYRVYQIDDLKIPAYQRLYMYAGHATQLLEGRVKLCF